MGADVLLRGGVALLLVGFVVMTGAYAHGVIDLAAVVKQTLSLIFALAVSFVGAWLGLRASDTSGE